MIKLYMAIPTLGTREDEQTYALRRIEKKYAKSIEFVYPQSHVGRLFHDFARNANVEQFLKSGCDLMWFLDGDVIPPDDVLDLITKHYDKWQLAGAVYPVWMTPPGYSNKQVVFTVYRDYKQDGKLAAATVIPTMSTDFVEGVATGCIFIKREVFDKLSRPWFEFKFDPITRDIAIGEDIDFCHKTNKLGLKFFVDFSLVCHHMKKVSLLEVNQYAIEFARSSVISHERSVRQAIAVKKLKALEVKPQSRLIL